MKNQQLLTRDGEVVSDIGSWERKMLEKEIKKEAPSDGIVKVTFRDPKFAYIYRSDKCKNKPPGYIVRIQINTLYYGAKSFSDKAYGGMQKALEAATKYRDAKMEELGIQGIVKKDLRGRKRVAE